MDDILKPINTPKEKKPEDNKPTKPKESNPKPSKPATSKAKAQEKAKSKSKSKSKAKTKPIEEPLLFIPSPEQQLIIDAIKRGENVSVNAVAGSGKTTTILGIAKQIPEKKILQITYNRALKLEVEKKAKLNKLDNLKVLTFHGLACSYYDYTAYTDDRIQTILRNNIPLNKPITNITQEIIIIDEIQDMTPLYFELIHKFLFDIKRSVIIGIMGDNYQGIYGFKGADERFLTLGDQIFCTSNNNHNNHNNPFTKLTLNTSYRLTQPMADFVNQVMVGGHQRIKSLKEGVPVKYIQYPHDELTDYISNLIADEMQTNGYKAEDIFILSGTLRNQRIKNLENKLVSNGFLCFVPISEDSKLDERIIKDKIVFTTFHQSKGRERKLVVVFGFDTSYYEMFKDKHSSLLICPNLLYVATTRASHQLVLLEHIDLKQSLPFLKMSHSGMMHCNFVDIHRHYTLDKPFDKHRNIDSNKMYVRREEDFEHDKTVTDLVKFIDESTLSLLGELITKIFKITNEIQESNVAVIPADIKITNQNGYYTYEQVCDINGVAIPAMLFSGSQNYNNSENSNYLWKYLSRQYLSNNVRSKNSSFILGYINQLKEKTQLEGVPDWLLLGNIYLCATEGYNYKLKQIQRYDWLEPEMVAKCHRNIANVFGGNMDDIHKNMNYELELGTGYDERGAFYGFKTETYGVVKIRGRIDCIDDDTVWELKCVDMLSIEHMLQVVLYAWMWHNIVLQRQENKDKQDNQNNQDKQDNNLQNGIDRLLNSGNERKNNSRDAYRDVFLDNIYQMKKFKLMNIRTGEVRELDTSNTQYIDDIVKILLDSKLRIRELLTDIQFIENSRGRVEKYKLDIANTYSVDELQELEETQNLEDARIEDARTEKEIEEIVLDF